MQEAVADIIQQLSELPPFPKVTTRLVAMLDDDSVTFGELAEVISADPSLVVKVIGMSNSPFYMVSRPIESVKDAVLVLGIDTLKSLTTAISIQKGLSKLTPRSDLFDMPAFWRHCYATAISAGQLSHKICPEHSDRFYLAGLIHDIGKLVQAYYWPEAWKAAINLLEVGRESFDVVEKSVFSLSHSEVTVTLCRNWKFPGSIVTLLEQSQSNETIQAPYSDANVVLSTANTIASAIGFRFPVEESSEIQYEHLDQFAEIMDELRGEVERQLGILYG